MQIIAAATFLIGGVLAAMTAKNAYKKTNWKKCLIWCVTGSVLALVFARYVTYGSYYGEDWFGIYGFLGLVVAVLFIYRSKKLFPGTVWKRLSGYSKRLIIKAKAGDVVAAYMMAERYRYGIEAPINERDSAMWYKVVADAGYTVAKNALQEMGYNQDGTKMT
jgi:TPR repeat protein